jgi:glycosyltransferase involved in cell wall biosynthesis
MGWETGHYLSEPELFRFEPDAIVMQRQVEWSQIDLVERYVRHSPAFRVFELDDLLTNVPVKSSRKKDFVQKKDLHQRFRKAVSLCHRFVVSTEFLAEEYKGYTDEVIAVPNYLERARWGHFNPSRRQDHKLRVGWAGSVTHDGDLMEIIDVVRATADEVDWVFFGMCPEELRPLIKEFHPPVPLDDYPAKLASLNLDLAVAPLEDVPFNHAKSHLRLLEYGVLGFPVICTDITPYRGAYPVTRVPNRYKDWVEAIRAHVADPDELARRGDALREHIVANWMLEDHLDVWLKAWLP